MHTFTLTIENIADQAHLDAIVDLVNTEAYVSMTRKVQ